jgi:hypothetical protein
MSTSPVKISSYLKALRLAQKVGVLGQSPLRAKQSAEKLND